jgi:hypothetical protein
MAGIDKSLELCDKSQIKKYNELLMDAIQSIKFMTEWEVNFMQSMQKLHRKGFILTKLQYSKIVEIIWDCEVKRTEFEDKNV